MHGKRYAFLAAERPGSTAERDENRVHLLGGQPSAQTEPQNAYDPASEMMQKALPVIGAIAQSGQNAVKPEKRALLGALKPFVAEEVSGQFDRALRLVSMARMARAALGQVNLSADDTAPRAL